MQIVDKLLDKFGYVNRKAVSLVQAQSLSMTAFDAESSGTSYSALCDNYRSWVYTSIDKIAKSVATIPLRFYIYKRKGKTFNAKGLKSYMQSMDTRSERLRFMHKEGIEKEEITEHPVIDLLNNPNTMSTRFILWYDTMVRLELKGECGWYLVRGIGGQPAEIVVLPLRKSASLKAIPDPKIMLKGFSYVDGNIRLTFKPEEVIFYRYPSPASPFTGMSPLLAQTYPYDIELYLMQQQRAMFKNKATPGMVFTTDQRLTDAQVTAMSSHVKTQFGKASKTGNPMFVHSGMKFDQKSGTTNKQMDIETIAEFTRDKIITAYDLSPGHVGLVKDVNRANMEVLQDSFVRECLKPKTMLIEEYLEKHLLPLYDDNLTAGFDLPDLEEKEFVLKERESNIKNGYTTINEERAKQGLDAVEWGDAPWFPLTQTQPDSAQREASAAKSLPVQVSTKHNVKLFTEAYWTEERKTAYWKKFVAQSEAHAQLFVAVMKRIWREQEKAILDALPANGKRLVGQIANLKFKDDAERLDKWLKQNATLAAIMPNRDEEVIKLAEAMQPVYVQVIEDVGGARFEELTHAKAYQARMQRKQGVDGFTLTGDLEFAYNVNDPSATQYIGQKLAISPSSITDTTFLEMEEILKEGFASGIPMTEIAANVSTKFAQYDQARALRIARTETISASNFADLDAVKQTGLEDTLRKFWLTSQDAHVRETHMIAGQQYDAGNAIDVKDDFFVGDDVMGSPGNGSVAGENVNCRCTLGYVERK